MKKLLFLFTILLLSGASAFAQSYHSDDKEGLRTFMRQPSAQSGKIHAEQLGLQISDTLNWQNNEEWVSKVAGLTWNNDAPKRLIQIGWQYKNLAGVLDASKWTSLTNLGCADNQLTTLNVSANTLLTNLYCHGNKLSSLDVSNNTALAVLYCPNNQFTALDVSVNTALTNLYCSGNPLTALDVSMNTALRVIECNSNQLTTLDVSANTLLINLHCTNNQLLLSELFAISERLQNNGANIGNRILGSQNLPAQTVELGTELDFSTQSVVNGINTVFSVLQYGSPAPVSNYTITNGKITFNTEGIYTIKMTNTAIISSPNNPAEVVLNVFAGEVSEIYILESEYFRVEIDHKLISITPDQMALWLSNLDSYYEQLVDLMSGFTPFGGNKIVIRSDANLPGNIWAYSGNPIRWSSRVISGTLNRFVTVGDWAFGMLHEIGHNFANYIGGYGSGNNCYNWNEEMFANFRMYLALTQLPNATVDAGGIIRHGAEIADYYQGDGLMWALIRLGNYYQQNNDHGFWLYKQAFEIINTSHCNDGICRLEWDKLNYLLNILSICAESDVWETFPDDEIEQLQSEMSKDTWQIGSPNAADVIATLENNILTISGTGAMQDFSEGSNPLLRCVENIIIHSGVTTIGDNAFYDLYNLTSIVIPYGITRIGDGSFNSCCKVSSVNIPSSVTYIGSHFFAWPHCGDGLTDVTVNWMEPLVIPSNTLIFAGHHLPSVNLHVPCGTQNLYAAAPVWQNFNIISEPCYHPDDKEGLRAFLCQTSAQAGEINAQRVGLQISDTLNWQNNEEWVNKVAGLTWNTETPKRLTTIDWGGKNFAGTLDASKWSELTKLICYHSHLTTLNVSANTALTELNCSGNQLSVLDVSASILLTNLSCNENNLVALDVSANVALTGLGCRYNQLTNLNVSANTLLTYLDCNTNHLLLSDLFTISERLQSNGAQIYAIVLFPQILPTQRVELGTELDFSTQSVFNGINTVFSVLQYGNPAPADNYTIINGKITFQAEGYYTIKMTNTAIISSLDHPAEVVLNVFVAEVSEIFIMESEHFRIEIAHELISITPQQMFHWLSNLDSYYEQLVDLMSGLTPFGGSKIKIVSADIWAWAFAGNPIQWNKNVISSTLNYFVTSGCWSFGMLHEIGHNFANNIGGYGSGNNCYNWNEEMFANFRMYLALTKLPDATVDAGGIIRHGAEIADYYQGDRFMWALIRLGNYYQQNNDYGFWLYKQAFEIINTSTCEVNDRCISQWDKFNYLLDILSTCAGSDVRETFPAGELELIQSDVPPFSLDYWEIGSPNAADVTATFEDGTLSISGSGAMQNWHYNSTSLPWFCVMNDIKNVIIDEGVTTIGNYAFMEFDSLASVTIPNSIIIIGDSTAYAYHGAPFLNCKSLTDVTVRWTTPLSIPTNTFYGVNLSKVNLHVPVNTECAYASASVWQNFKLALPCSIFHEDDKEGLHTFLRQPSAQAGEINAQRLDLQISDTLNWQTNEEWVSMVAGLTWNNDAPKRLIQIGWQYKNLAGTLDASKWASLTILGCADNQLTALNVSANTVLTDIYCHGNQLTTLDVSNNTTLAVLYCPDNQLTSITLDASTNPLLTFIHCAGNQLPLSGLFAASEVLENNGAINNNRILGAQILPAQTIELGTELDFLVPQNIFNGIYTQFTVTKNGYPAHTNDYTVTNGNITFHTAGVYNVIMTNAAIISRPVTPAEVKFNVTVTLPTYTITATAGANGTINPSGAVSVNHGASQQFDFTPSLGYRIEQVLINGVNNPTAVAAGIYTFENVTSDYTIEVTFARNMKWSNPTGIYSGNMTIIGVVVLDGIELRSDMIEVGAFYGEECRGTRITEYVADFDKYLCFLMVYGETSVPLTFKVYDHETETEYDAENTMTYITDLVIGNPVDAYEFIVNTTYTITANADTYGTIDPSGEVIVYRGADQTFTFTPNIGYQIDQVLIDEINNPVAVASGAYTFENVTANHTIAVTFAVIPQTITLNTGWNWISTNMLSSSPSILDQMKTSLNVVGEQIKSCSAFIQLYGTTWVGTLASISEKEMYQAKVTAGHSMTLYGELADPDATPIPINYGWNCIGYVPSFPTEVSYALSGVNAQTGDMIKNNAGYSTFYGTSWYGTLPNMQSGCGYKYSSTSTTSKTFYYPSTAAKSPVTEYKPSFELRTAPQKGLYAGNMTVTAILMKNNEALLGDGIEIEAFCGKECRGSALMRYEADFDRYLCYLMIHGEGGEMITLRVYDHVTGKEYTALNTPFPFIQDKIKGSLLNPYIVNLEEDISVGIDEGVEEKISIYPNPTKDQLYILHPWTSIDVVEIVDVYGRIITRETNFSKNSINIKDMARGVYMLRIVNNSKEIVIKFVKV